MAMDIQAKFVDMDMDMDGKFHIHGNPENVGKYWGDEKILSPPWFQHCGGESPRSPTPFRRLCLQASHNSKELETLPTGMDSDMEVMSTPPSGKG